MTSPCTLMLSIEEVVKLFLPLGVYCTHLLWPQNLDWWNPCILWRFRLLLIFVYISFLFIFIRVFCAMKTCGQFGSTFMMLLCTLMLFIEGVVKLFPPQGGFCTQVSLLPNLGWWNLCIFVKFRLKFEKKNVFWKVTDLLFVLKPIDLTYFYWLWLIITWNCRFCMLKVTFSKILTTLLLFYLDFE